MEAQEQQDPAAATPPPPPEAQPQCDPSAGAPTFRQRLNWLLPRPAAPVIAIVVLSVGCVAALWAASWDSSPAGRGVATQKSARKTGGKSGQKDNDLRIPRWMLENDASPDDGKRG